MTAAELELLQANRMNPAFTELLAIEKNRFDDARKAIAHELAFVFLEN